MQILVGFAPGGAADQMARAVQGIITKNKLMKQAVVVINKPAAGGADAMLELKASSGDPQKILIVNSSLYTIGMTTKFALNWRDFTPVAMLAQDDFLLWVNDKAPYSGAVDFMKAIKDAGSPLRFGGSGSKREDHFISLAVGRAAGKDVIYVPYAGGGPASVQLAGGHIDANVNNPAEEIANWRGGMTRPLCVFSPRPIPYSEKVTADRSWRDIPTCASQGLDFTYQMLRGFFLPAAVSADQQAFFVDLMKKVSETSDWRDYLARNALTSDFRTGETFGKFLAEDEIRHRELMDKAGFLNSN